MSFYIQVGQPHILHPQEVDSWTLEEAIESIFPMSTEDAIMRWMGVPILLNYKYDLSVICEDILDLVEPMLDSDSGMHNVEWPSNTFRAIWNVKWLGDDLTCNAKWFAVSGDLEDLLNQRGHLETRVTDFLSEWTTLLRKIYSSLNGAGFSTESLPVLNRIGMVINKCIIPGKLYRHSGQTV